MFSNVHTFVLGDKCTIRAAAAFPALFSSRKLIVEFITSRQRIPKKSCQSGPSPWNNVNKNMVIKWTWEVYQRAVRKKKYDALGQSNARVQWTHSTVSKDNCHHRCCFHNPWQGIPHETEKFQKFVLLHGTSNGSEVKMEENFISSFCNLDGY